jgi:serine protease Do
MLRPLDRHATDLLRALIFALLLTSGVAACFSQAAIASSLRRSPVVEAVQKVRPSVVNIHGRKTIRSEQVESSGGDAFRQVNGMGTGIIIDPRGYILTNHHVVENVEVIHVILEDKREFIGRFVAHDPVSDLAIIRIDTGNLLPVIDMGISSDLMPGESVIAVGNAFGYEHTVTCGIISALHREVQVSATQKYRDLIQTDASINPGNSGGPLLNIDGQMIGVNVAVRVGAQGIGFAIPVDEALDIAARLLSVERIDQRMHGVIGQSHRQEGFEGLVISELKPESPARLAGLQRGDVIRAVEDMAVRRQLDLERALLGREVDQPVMLKIDRDGQPQTVELRLASLRSGDLFEQMTWRVLGLRLVPIPSAEFRDLNTRYRGGLRITAVRSDSTAAAQGIQNGDVLVGMHVWETISQENVRYVLNHSDLQRLQPIKFYVVRGRETLYGHLTIDPLQVHQVAGQSSRRG